MALKSTLGFGMMRLPVKNGDPTDFDYRVQGPVKDLSRFEDLTLYGVPVTAIMEGYSVCQFQPDPRGSDDNNYLLNAIAEEIHRDFKEDLPREQLVNKAGEDVTDEIYQAYDWLREHTF